MLMTHAISYFIAGPDKDANMKASAGLTESKHQEFPDFFRHWVLQRDVFIAGKR